MEDESVMVAPKPKKVLTEAQRLAFIKGREKRMANIAKKREEKLALQGMEETPQVPPSTPDIAVETPVAAPKTPPMDLDKIADSVAKRVTESIKADLPPPPPPKKPRKPRAPRAIVSVPEPPSPRHEQVFNWA
jgi:hypothetical protein